MDPRPDVVIVSNRAAVTRDVLADAVDLVWRARSGHPSDGDAGTGSRMTRTIPGTSTTATTNCVAR